MRIKDNIFYFYAILYIFLFYIFLQKHYFHYDDAYITYIFAKNFAQGYGIVYHPSLNPVQGSSTLFYTFLLGILTFFTKIETHQIGLFLSILFFLIASKLIFEMIKDKCIMNSFTIQNLLLFVILSFQIPIIFSLGLETNFVLLLWISTLYCMIYKKYYFFYFLFPLMISTRLELYVVLVFVMFYPLSINLKIRLFLLNTLILFFILVFNKLYFGNFLPNTWIAKSFFNIIFEKSKWYDFFLQNWYLLLYYIGIFLFLFRKRNNIDFSFLFLILIAHFVLFTIIYKGAPQMPWYFVVPLSLTFYYCLYQINKEISNEKLIIVFYLFIIGINFYITNVFSDKFFLKDSLNNVLLDKRYINDRREIIGKYLASIDKKISSKKLLFFEAGKIPYYSNGIGIDILGLCSPEAIEGLSKNNSNITFLKVNPDYVIGVYNSDYFPMQFITSKRFLENYEIIFKIQDYVIWKKRIIE